MPFQSAVVGAGAHAPARAHAAYAETITSVGSRQKPSTVTFSPRTKLPPAIGTMPSRHFGAGLATASGRALDGGAFSIDPEHEGRQPSSSKTCASSAYSVGS